MHPPATCLFDLDGTLSDPALGIGRSINHALAVFGYQPIAAGDVSQYIGPPAGSFLSRHHGHHLGPPPRITCGGIPGTIC